MSAQYRPTCLITSGRVTIRDPLGNEGSVPADSLLWRREFFNRALELFEKGDYIKARLEVKNAQQIDPPKYAEGYQLLGRIEQKAGNLKEAFGAFGKAVELKPELSLSQIEMGKMLLMGGATDKAMERAEAVLAKEPENVDALILKGSVLLVKKQPDGAIAVFEGLRTRGVKNPEVYMALANAHAQKKNAAQAEKMLQEGVAANPDSVPTCSWRAMRWRSSGLPRCAFSRPAIRGRRAK